MNSRMEKGTVDEAKAADFQKHAWHKSDTDTCRCCASGGCKISIPPNVSGEHGSSDARHPDATGPLRNVPVPKPVVQCNRFVAL